MNIPLPELSLVALIGASSSGKSRFAARHFRAPEVLSSDAFRALVANDENVLDANEDAFDSLYFVAGKRLARGLLTVVDATNVQPSARKRIVELARAHDVLPVAVVLDVEEDVLVARHEVRGDRPFGAGVVRGHAHDLRRSVRNLEKEGFRHVFHLRGAAAVEAAVVERVPLWVNRRELKGPFDIIGDVHGCLEELRALLTALGYVVEDDLRVTPPPGRTAVFVGDLVDRGPDAPGVLRLVMGMVRAGAALCVPGNHDVKLERALSGRRVQATHGLDLTLAQLEAQPPAFRAEVLDFLGGLVSHYVLDDGRLVVAHAGLPERYQGRTSGRVREFALYGDTEGVDAAGLPLRRDWAADYRGRALVVYGHTPVAVPRALNNTLNVDTGCVFGGALSALRYPEGETVGVPALRAYAVPARPFKAREVAGIEAAAPLVVTDFLGKQVVETGLLGRVTLREEETAGALEVLGRFAVDPRWLVYLPPTMSPSETSVEADVLEHPREAFAHYRRLGVARVVCEEKHMGSRAVLVLARDAAAAARRFGVADGRAGVVYTRTGRAFFDAALEAAVVERARAAVQRAGLWDVLGTDWVVLDAEVLPWSLKAEGLIREQYAAVGAVANATLPAAVEALQAACARGLQVQGLLERTAARAQDVGAYRDAYRRYVQRVTSVADVRVAPFHLLASEGGVHMGQPHAWHLEQLARLAEAAPDLFLATRHTVVDLGDDASEAAATQWWLDLTRGGGEGMVVKPAAFTARGPKGLLQPALKVRGREYLRIIYGAEYTQPEHLARLRERHLGAKRARALREFALGVEGLTRFVGREPLWRVHQCVLGVLAFETDPVDPRL
ncbi:polynucleotide kinase-phosphatase [Deinococcus maricopensis]|uniref:Bis(5'-nucleosyl)-tetraphosphatase(Asymmetrical) n=1 Tax=Deinococcus maricopensis (strain DSM 21211 / LMG 22137 / NRRL B-23946 / LB-34) TaxID=709986 RepID=E8U4N4_DEIML|nr:polynucleotide kinase-phosphatase [Deinococcus maricopensis]ADV68899.1 Bis(5'-nucleosyl)-tetraphosphatase(asymmetrical) [Deinococcus maricopensis DSM 21211]